MMFRESNGPRGSWVRCIRTVYDDKIKRGRQILVGKFRPYDDVPEDVLKEMTEPEKIEAKKWLSDHKARNNQVMFASDMRWIVTSMLRVTRYLNDTATRDDAVKELVKVDFPAAFEEFSLALKKVKMPRPKKEKPVVDGQPGPLLTAMNAEQGN